MIEGLPKVDETLRDAEKTEKTFRERPREKQRDRAEAKKTLFRTVVAAALLMDKPQTARRPEGAYTDGFFLLSLIQGLCKAKFSRSNIRRQRFTSRTPD